MRRLPTLLLTATIVSSCGVTPEEVATFTPAPLYVDAHVPLAHGPLPAPGSTPVWGIVELWDNAGNGERWLGDVAGAYWGHPTGGKTWIAKSADPGTYAVAYEFAAPPWGRSYVVTSTFKQLAWTIGLVTIQYDNPCQITPGMAVVHACSGDWTPMDSGGLATAVIGNGIVKPGLPYGDYLHWTGDRNAPGSWCTANLSDYPAITPPPGLPNHVVAVDACP